jgi:hypothetical protein
MEGKGMIPQTITEQRKEKEKKKSRKNMERVKCKERVVCKARDEERLKQKVGGWGAKHSETYKSNR